MIWDLQRFFEVLPRSLTVCGITFLLLTVIKGFESRMPPKLAGRLVTALMWTWLVVVLVVHAGGVRW